jgi:hypothetical protein
MEPKWLAHRLRTHSSRSARLRTTQADEISFEGGTVAVRAGPGGGEVCAGETRLGSMETARCSPDHLEVGDIHPRCRVRTEGQHDNGDI